MVLKDVPLSDLIEAILDRHSAALIIVEKREVAEYGNLGYREPRRRMWLKGDGGDRDALLTLVLPPAKGDVPHGY